MMFWNVEGLADKQQDFWKYVNSFDIICLSGTQVLADGLDTYSLSDDYAWTWTPALICSASGKPVGGLLTGIRATLTEIEIPNETRDDIQTRKFIVGATTMTVVSVHRFDEGSEDFYERLREITKDNTGEMVIGGDFNARLGQLCGPSKDKTIDSAGYKLHEFVNGEALKLLNGDHEGNKEGELTFIGHGTGAVTDYVITAEHTVDVISSMVVSAILKSNHLPLEVSMGEIKKVKAKDIRPNITIMEPLQYAKQHLQETQQLFRSGKVAEIEYEVEKRAYNLYEKIALAELANHGAELAEVMYE